MTKDEFYEKWVARLFLQEFDKEFQRDLNELHAPPISDYLTSRFEGAQLTTTECEIARMLLRGWTMQQITGSTSKTDTTIRHHMASIFHKFDVGSRTELLQVLIPISEK